MGQSGRGLCRDGARRLVRSRGQDIVQATRGLLDHGTSCDREYRQQPTIPCVVYGVESLQRYVISSSSCLSTIPCREVAILLIRSQRYRPPYPCTAIVSMNILPCPNSKPVSGFAFHTFNSSQPSPPLTILDILPVSDSLLCANLAPVDVDASPMRRPIAYWLYQTAKACCQTSSRTYRDPSACWRASFKIKSEKRSPVGC
jgi:hypothetical protein